MNPTASPPLPTPQAFLQVGYTLFAEAGPAALRIEVLARAVGKRKSSFYHHFADLEGFTEQLFDLHLERARHLAEQERRCQRVIPDLLEVLLHAKEDLLFGRQLRIHRHLPAYGRCLEQVARITHGAVTPIWADMLGLGAHPQPAEMLLQFSLENFYLQITPQTLTYDWLLAYLHELKVAVRALQSTAPKFKDDKAPPTP